MQKDSRFFDDISKLASGAFGTLADMKREMEAMIMDKTEQMLARMNLVRREEFEVVRAMAEQARAEQERLSQKIAEIEKLLDHKETPLEGGAKRTKK